MGVVIGSRINRASPKEALTAIGGYALVLDMTVRDFQVCFPKSNNSNKLRDRIDLTINRILIFNFPYYRMS